MSEQGNIPIAEDLRYVYGEASVDPPRPARKWPLRARDNVIRHSIERISRAEAEVAQLKAELEKRESLLDKFCASNDRLLAENERLKAPVENIARSAAKEIAECFNIITPSEVSYANGILGTIKIIIETHFRGESRDALLTARTGGSNGK